MSFIKLHFLIPYTLKLLFYTCLFIIYSLWKQHYFQHVQYKKELYFVVLFCVLYQFLCKKRKKKVYLKRVINCIYIILVLLDSIPGLPLYLEKPRIWQFRQKKHEIWKTFKKTLNFEQKSLKNLEFSIILTWIVVEFKLKTKFYPLKKI